jgi:hypothetical protein
MEERKRRVLAAHRPLLGQACSHACGVYAERRGEYFSLLIVPHRFRFRATRSCTVGNSLYSR